MTDNILYVCVDKYCQQNPYITQNSSKSLHSQHQHSIISMFQFQTQLQNVYHYKKFVNTLIFKALQNSIHLFQPIIRNQRQYFMKQIFAYDKFNPYQQKIIKFLNQKNKQILNSSQIKQIFKITQQLTSWYYNNRIIRQVVGVVVNMFNSNKLSWNLYDEKIYHLVLQFYENLIKFSSVCQKSQLYFLKAKLNRENGYYDIAIQGFKYCLAKNPNRYQRYQILSQMGLCYIQIKDYQKGEKILNQAMSLFQENYLAYNYKAILHQQKHEFKQAEKYYTILLKKYPNNNKYIQKMAIVSFNLNKYNQAIYYFNRLPLSLELNNNRIICYIKLADYHNAYLYLESYQKFKNKDTRIYYYRGIISYVQKKYNTAQFYLQYFIKLQAYSSNLTGMAYQYLSKIQYNRKRYKQALIYSEAASKINKLDKFNYGQTGLIYEQMKKQNEAIDNYQKAFMISNESTNSIAVLQLCYQIQK